MSGNEKVSLETLKALRARTGAGVMECRRALEEGEGNLEAAERILTRAAGEAAARKASGWTGEGTIAAYVHHNGRVATLVELGCRTDFVALTEEFRTLAARLAEQLAAVPVEIPEDGADSRSETDVFLAQEWIREPGTPVGMLVDRAALKFDEPIRVRRLVRLSVDETLEAAGV